MSTLEDFFEIPAAIRRRELSERDYGLITFGAALALAETGREDSFESLHEGPAVQPNTFFRSGRTAWTPRRSKLP
jgi:hypothetical protein